MRMASLAFAWLFILGIAWSDDLLFWLPARPISNNPYGVWSTGLGQVIEVRRDGTYRYCDGEDCTTGQMIVDHNGAWLLRFYDLKATKNLRDLSGDVEFPSRPSPLDDPVTEGSFLLVDHGPDAGDGCRARPCRPFGDFKSYDEYAFTKNRDY